MDYSALGPGGGFYLPPRRFCCSVYQAGGAVCVGMCVLVDQQKLMQLTALMKGHLHEGEGGRGSEKRDFLLL